MPAPAFPSSTLNRAQHIAGAVRLSQLVPQNIRWLWPGKIPLGRVTLLVGDPGLGKSLLTLDIAARVSAGRPWPDEEGERGRQGEGENSKTPHSQISPSSVLLLTVEDDFADTVRPRLQSLGADCDRIFGIDSVPGDKPDDVPRLFALNRDLARLQNLLDALPDCRLIVIDPINAYLGSTNTDLQSLLHSLAKIARERDIAVLLVSHFRKKDGATLYRTLGSVAFVAAARSSWAICPDPIDTSKRLLLPVKNNLAPAASGLAFTIESHSGVPRISWSPEPVTMSVEFAITAARANGRPDEERQYAVKWLEKHLKKAPCKANDVRDEADMHGISYGTLRRAFRDIGGIAVRKGCFPLFDWYWSLPGRAAQNP